MFCGPHFEHISVDFSNVVLQVCSIILRKKGLKYHEETLLHIQTYYSNQYNTSETQDSGCLLTRSIINYKYDFEMRKKKRSEMANFYMTWWCVCVYIWFSMHFMPRDLFSEPMNCQLGNSKGMNENEIALFTILRKVWSEKKSTLQNHQVYCTYFNGNTRPNLILMFNGWIVIQNICK